jgi:two-component system NarL family response regulator
MAVSLQRNIAWISDQHEYLHMKSAASLSGKIRLVVADDHPIVREGIVANLRQEREMKVIAEASDGGEALAVVRKFQPDVMLLDLRMPTHDGIEILTQLTALNVPTKAIVFTTFESPEDIQRSMKAGARGYLLKDCSRQTLVEAIRRVHRGEIYLPPSIAQKLVERIQNPQLTQRELDVLSAMAAGKSNKEIGSQLFIAEGTVKTHVANLLAKLSVGSRMEAIRKAVQLGLVHMD